jgi:hypothetical protein
VIIAQDVRNVGLKYFVDDYYSVDKFRKAYMRRIPPITVDAKTVVFDNGSHEDVTTDAALVRVETPPSSPPRSVKWLVKKITPRKNLKRAATRE